eukprot:365582-Chlamydomonas_euryale.AAC.14
MTRRQTGGFRSAGPDSAAFRPPYRRQQQAAATPAATDLSWRDVRRISGCCVKRPCTTERFGRRPVHLAFGANVYGGVLSGFLCGKGSALGLCLRGVGHIRGQPHARSVTFHACVHACAHACAIYLKRRGRTRTVVPQSDRLQAEYLFLGILKV